MSGQEVIVWIAFFAVVFGIFFMYLTTRNKERLALIEKGKDATIFRGAPFKFSIAKFILNAALLFVGIGVGIVVAGILDEILHVKEEIAFPGSIFIFGGIGLVIGFYLTRKIEKSESRDAPES